MIHEKMPYLFDDKDLIENKELIARGAKKIIAISENTKKDIIEIYGIPESKIEVIHLATSINNLKLNLNLNLPKKYLLFVGSRFGYKNFQQFLIESKDLIINTVDLFLLCVGGGVFNKEELELINYLGISNKVIQKDMSERDLFTAYSKAELFVFPSLYEGFGIPILEAFASSCPVILSNRSCFPEIAGEAALYFDPDITGSLKKSIQSIMSSKKLRESLVSKGHKRLKLYSWSKNLNKTIHVYEKVLNESRIY
jgi:glycosyltransferase involved in cell wall biosynthesis